MHTGGVPQDLHDAMQEYRSLRYEHLRHPGRDGTGICRASEGHKRPPKIRTSNVHPEPGSFGMIGMLRNQH